MKKSIMLSATIMLVILFLTLTTTTFAWYQAQGGEIHVSGSSTASVTTTGPDSPYLVIGTSRTENGVAGIYAGSSGSVLLSTITGATEPNSAYLSTTFSGGAMQLASLKSGQSFGTNNWEHGVYGTDFTPIAITFYIRNTSSSFDLLTNVVISYSDSSSNDLTNNTSYSYALVFSSNVRNTNDSADQLILNSASHYNDGTSVSAVKTEYTVSPAVDTRVRIQGDEVITCTLYLWLDSYNGGSKITNSSVVSSIVDIANLSISFENIEIATS